VFVLFLFGEIKMGFKVGESVFVSNPAAHYYQITGEIERTLPSGCYEVRLENGRFVTYQETSLSSCNGPEDIYKQFNIGDIVKYQGLGILFNVHSHTDSSGNITIGYFDSIGKQYLRLSVKSDSLELNKPSFESLIASEAKRAVELHGQFNSLHEGYGVIKEEFDEVWDEIKKKVPDKEQLKTEIVQTAAMLKKLYDYVEST
jgi:hypothetical protein